MTGRRYDAAMPSPYSRRAEDAPTFSVVSDIYRVLASEDSTGGMLGLIDAIVPPGGGPPPHVHTREDEFFYILDGEITFYIESGEAMSTLLAKRGTFVFAPRNQKHRFRNESGATARMLFGVLPGGMERLFEDAGTRLEPGATAAAPFTEPDLIKLAQTAAERYGCQIFPPAE